MKFNTEGYGGRKVRESAGVETNDPTKKDLTIALIGMVEKFAIVTPDRVTIIGSAGSELKSHVTVSPTAQYPFKVTGMRLKNGEFIQASYEWKDGEKKAYVQIENRMKEKGRYVDAVILTTDSPIKPEIHIPVYGILR